MKTYPYFPENTAASTALTCDRWRLTESTALFYDGWELNAEANAQTGSITAVYLHGADIDEIIARADITNANAPNVVVYYTYDHLGSVRALSNAAGNILESYQYEAFGKPTIFDASGNVIARSAFGNRFMFTGREYLDTIQLYDYRNRTYSPQMGQIYRGGSHSV